MSSDLRAVLRRLKPDKHVQKLAPRKPAALPIIDLLSSLSAKVKVLYDTTVYVDILQGRLPKYAELLVRSAEAWHSTITEAELAIACGLLDPSHPESRGVIEDIAEVLELRPPHRTIAPDRGIWIEAAVLAGILARVQQYGSVNRGRILNDALLFATARKYGLTLVTRNIHDFDLLQQLDPSGRVLFYQI